MFSTIILLRFWIPLFLKIDIIAKVEMSRISDLITIFRGEFSYAN